MSSKFLYCDDNKKVTFCLSYLLIKTYSQLYDWIETNFLIK